MYSMQIEKCAIKESLFFPRPIMHLEKEIGCDLNGAERGVAPST